MLRYFVWIPQLSVSGRLTLILDLAYLEISFYYFALGLLGTHEANQIPRDNLLILIQEITFYT